MPDTKQCHWCDTPITEMEDHKWSHRTGWVHVDGEDDSTHYAQPKFKPRPGPPTPPPLKQVMYG